ncbi:MAG: GGDEF domain-containing protein [Rubrivivax sp.]
MPLGPLALLFVAASVAVAALLGFGLAAWIEPVSPWMVGLASAVGVLCMALPLGVTLLGLARNHRAAAVPASSSATVAAATTTTEAVLPEPLPAAAARGVPQGLVLTRENFRDMVAREWSRARRYGTGAALLLVQVDRYPRLTEALGEAAGEKVLADMIAATAPTLRGADALARQAGGEFAVFLAHADATGALDVAERIRERAEQMEVTAAGRRVRFTVSVGVAHLRPAHLHLQALVDDVTEALAAARTVGGNCVRAAPVDVRPAAGPARDGSRADKS